MSLYNQYLNNAKNKEIVSYQEAINYLDSLVEKGIIESYDESVIEDVLNFLKNKGKKAITVGLLLTALSSGGLKSQEVDYNPIQSPIELIDSSLNVKTDLDKLQKELVKINASKEEFKKLSEPFLVELKKLNESLNVLSELKINNEPVIAKDKINYYRNQIKETEKYIKVMSTVSIIDDVKETKIKQK